VSDENGFRLTRIGKDMSHIVSMFNVPSIFGH
jgi:hypothetical protein